MIRNFYFITLLFIFSCTSVEKNQTNSKEYNEPYRPQVHFSPKTGWMNDPNGMVYFKGAYHLFYQYYPDSTVWGPMHWGHATSTDLVHWEQQPIALYPDSLGYIFSGSAVVDIDNTSGFGKDGKVPLVAIFTHHDPVGEKSGSITFQNQSIAYSLDEGKTWTKYAGNPVLKNPGIKDFRDPKISWNQQAKKWIMTLATLDRITFYSSPNLKEWTKESEFGKEVGAHGGVWECPDLFSLEDTVGLDGSAGQGKKVWILIVNINPGGPNRGSGTQYFVGSFDGNKFTASDKQIKWLDYGPDDYAGITWSNTGNRKIFLGWMSNWLYANQVPTVKWRNAMTIPRELKVIHIGTEVFVVSEPVKELNEIKETPIIAESVAVDKSLDITPEIKDLKFPCQFDLSIGDVKDFSLELSNDTGQKLAIGYDKKNNQYYIDRTKSGNTGFQKDFAAKHTAPRFAKNQIMNISLIIDVSSVELFADDGLTVMTEIFFPDTPFNKMSMHTKDNIIVKKWSYARLKNIWK